MNIEVPGLRGIEATSQLKRLMPRILVVVATILEEPTTLDAIRPCAVG